jgi:hypothetical protein
MKAGLAMGWPALGLLVALLFYFKFSISDPVANKRAVFKTFIGILAAFFLFMAIANYKMNFFAESRLLPVSLVLITSTAFEYLPFDIRHRPVLKYELGQTGALGNVLAEHISALI